MSDEYKRTFQGLECSLLSLFVKDTAGRRSTALHFASGYGRKDVVEHLLANGANIAAKDDGGLNPLHK